MAYNPSTEPNEADRMQGRERALELLQGAHQNASVLNLPDSQRSGSGQSHWAAQH